MYKRAFKGSDTYILINLKLNPKEKKDSKGREVCI